MNILIATGIYPPKIGGPAQYAKNLKEEFERMGHRATVKTFSIENYLPSGIRHIYFFFKIIPAVLKSEIIFILDTFSVGLPTVLACKLFGKKSVLRTGGDFLWEQYVERTGKKVLLRNFYLEERENFSRKDRIIFSLTKWTLLNTSKIIFSTEWQRDIFIAAYCLEKDKTTVVENYYGQKDLSASMGVNSESKKLFIASSRNLKLKNLDILKKITDKIKRTRPEIELFTKELFFVKFVEKTKSSYAVLQVSLSEVSPNLILEAIKYSKPFICTKEVGVYERIKDIGIFVNPLDENEIEKAVLGLLNEENYKRAVEKVKSFSFTHSWKQIAEEFISVWKLIH